MEIEEELKKLRAENHDLKEQIQNYIPRRRVRRVYKQLKKILEQDLIEQNYGYINYLKSIIDRHKIIKENNQTAVIVVDDTMITAIENLIGFYEPDERYKKKGE